MPADICSVDMPFLHKKALHDALGIEIFLYKVARPFIKNYHSIGAYYYMLRLPHLLKKYLTTYDLNVCARCHGFEECSKIFYNTEKNLLAEMGKYLPIIEDNIKKIRLPWLFIKSIEILQNYHEEFEDRIENMEIILETRDGILNEIASALDEAEPKLKNWRKALPFLQ